MTIAFDQRRKRSRSATGIPSSSAITVIGSGKAKSSTRSISPSRLDGVDQVVGDLLDARPELLDHPRRERLRHEPAQPPVVVAVLVEHVLLDERERLGRPLDSAASCSGVERERRVPDEALVVEQHARRRRRSG